MVKLLFDEWNQNSFLWCSLSCSLSTDMNGGGGAGGLPAMGGGAGLAGSPEGVALVHDTRCHGAFFGFL
jgi:hypothetical protein